MLALYLVQGEMYLHTTIAEAQKEAKSTGKVSLTLARPSFALLIAAEYTRGFRASRGPPISS